MMTDISLPLITATDDTTKLVQMQSYLFQMVGQLNYALGQVDGMAIKASETAGKAIEAASTTVSKPPKQTFNEIKSLIIKSADIVESLYEQINLQLAGDYVAQSTFGVFQENTLAKIEGNSTGITQIYSDVQSITGAVAEIRDSIIDVNAYIKTGLLYYSEDGSPVYGVEIGQSTEIDGVTGFQRYTRISSNRIGFFDQNGTEVAWITDRVLHITKAEIQDLTATTARIDRITIGDYTIGINGGHLFVQ